MAAFCSNIAAGKVAYYGSLPAGNDGLVWILLQSAGLSPDATLRDYTTVAALLAGATNEASFGGYARVVQTTGATVFVDNTANTVNMDATSPIWPTSTSVQALGKICLAYDPNVGTGTDAELVPLFYDNFVASSPSQGSLTYNVNASGWARADPA